MGRFLALKLDGILSKLKEEQISPSHLVILRLSLKDGDPLRLGMELDLDRERDLERDLELLE